MLSTKNLYIPNLNVKNTQVFSESCEKKQLCSNLSLGLR